MIFAHRKARLLYQMSNLINSQSYTDFPLDQVKLCFIDGVLILPSEY